MTLDDRFRFSRVDAHRDYVSRGLNTTARCWGNMERSFLVKYESASTGIEGVNLFLNDIVQTCEI